MKSAWEDSLGSLDTSSSSGSGSRSDSGGSSDSGRGVTIVSISHQLVSWDTGAETGTRGSIGLLVSVL
jgi:hypothetical protein